MSVEWKIIYDQLIEGVEDLNIVSYRLTDGSYIIGEEIGSDEAFDIILMDLPVLVCYDRSGRINLKSWMFQGMDENYGKPIPVELYTHSIISRSEPPLVLKQEFIKYNFLSEFQKYMTDSELIEAMDHMNSSAANKSNVPIEALDTREEEEELIRLFLKRLDYPDKN